MSTRADEIEIPDRIERRPTDILKAISSTLTTDYTAPHYRFHDDPWLIPYTQNEKREFTIAKESGRNAARFILQNHPNLFTKNRIEAEPPITAFQPRAIYNRDNVTVELLENMLVNFQVFDATDVYELLVEKKKEIPAELKQNLLEMLAFYSEDEPLTPENQDSKNMLPVVQSWAAGGLAETLYSQLNSPAARLAMLLGLARHKQYMRAMQVWGEVEANKDPVPVEGYNAYITALSFDDFNKVKVEITNVLTKMKEAKIAPDAETLVCCLEAVARACNKHKGNYPASCELGLSLLSEFRAAVGVEPSLGAFYQLLEIFYSKTNRERPMIMKDFLDALEGKDMWPAKSVQDFNFFSRAMEVCAYLNNTRMAYRLHEMLLSGKNVNLLGNAMNLERYYLNFILLVLRTEDIDVAMDLYSRITPHIWSPRRDLFNALLMEINTKSAVQYLGKVFDDMELCSYGGSSKKNIYEMNTLVLRCMDAHPAKESEFNNLGQTYSDISKRIFKHLVLNKASDALYLRFNTHAAGICTLAMKLLLLEGEFESSVEILDFCVEEKERMPGQLGEQVLETLLDSAVANENPDVGLQVVDYLVSMNSTRSRDCGEKLASLPLSPNLRSLINKLFSFDPKWNNV